MSIIKKYNIFLIIGLFIIIFDPPVLELKHIVGLLSIAFLLTHMSYTRKVLKTKSVNFLIKMGVTFTFYYMYIVLMSNSGNVIVVYTYVFLLFEILPFALVLLYFHQKRELVVEDYMQLIVSIGFIQAIFVALSMLIPSVHNFFLTIYASAGQYGEHLDKLAMFRIYGFAASLTSSSAFFQGLATVFAIILSQKKGNIFLLIAFFIAMSGIVNARTTIGIIAVGVFIIFLFGQQSVFKKFLIVLIVAISFSFANLLLESEFGVTFEWMFSGFNEIGNALQGDTNQGYFSYVTDKDRYKLPFDFCGIIFGKGHGIMTSIGSLQSDIGYVNDIWKGGIISVFLIIYFYGKILKFFVIYHDKTIKLCGWIFIISLLMLNFKGMIFGMNDFMIAIVIFYVILSANKRSINCSN